MTYSIYMPAKCFWGNGCVCENSSALALGKNCLIVTGKNSAKLSGALDDAREFFRGIKLQLIHDPKTGTQRVGE